MFLISLDMKEKKNHFEFTCEILPLKKQEKTPTRALIKTWHKSFQQLAKALNFSFCRTPVGQPFPCLIQLNTALSNQMDFVEQQQNNTHFI